MDPFDGTFVSGFVGVVVFSEALCTIGDGSPVGDLDCCGRSRLALLY